ncbi:TetR family transcriptional regulator [Nocardia sp. XZ_19_385]|uniref:TetR family transcriptional regulator n=1 Tax=Nocardia sp. XZ_19_385 TaxID=2769488 RepID=UPI00188FAF55|nr:TetR family transcriptional regulator [Nocardia sp. XZ_19_385]
MTSQTPSVRLAARELVRERILEAATELAGTAEWKSIRMTDIADRAGVSRRTVFNEFESKSGVLEAMAWRHTGRYLEGAAALLTEHSDDPVAAITAVAEFLLSAVAADPLAQSALNAPPDEPGELLALATTRSAPYIDAVTQFYIAFAEQHWATLIRPGVDLPFFAESLVRLTFSHMIRPSAAPPDTARSLGRLAAALLLQPR